MTFSAVGLNDIVPTIGRRPVGQIALSSLEQGHFPCQRIARSLVLRQIRHQIQVIGRILPQMSRSIGFGGQLNCGGISLDRSQFGPAFEVLETRNSKKEKNHQHQTGRTQA